MCCVSRRNPQIRESRHDPCSRIAQCLALPASEFGAKIEVLTGAQCRLDLTRIVAHSVAPQRCQAHEDDAKLVQLAGHTCAQAQALSMCKMMHFSALDKLCPCACKATLVGPAAAATHGRRMFGTIAQPGGGSSCTMRGFDARMAHAVSACCPANNSYCSSVPRDCTYNCSKARTLAHQPSRYDICFTTAVRTRH